MALSCLALKQFTSLGLIQTKITFHWDSPFMMSLFDFWVLSSHKSFISNKNYYSQTLSNFFQNGWTCGTEHGAIWYFHLLIPTIGAHLSLFGILTVSMLPQFARPCLPQKSWHWSCSCHKTGDWWYFGMLPFHLCMFMTQLYLKGFSSVHLHHNWWQWGWGIVGYTYTGLNMYINDVHWLIYNASFLMIWTFCIQKW